MILYFTYNQQTGKVNSYSKSLNQVDEKFKQIRLELTDEEYLKLQQNYDLFIVDNKLIFQENMRTIKHELLQELQKPNIKWQNVKQLLIQSLK